MCRNFDGVRDRQPLSGKTSNPWELSRSAAARAEAKQRRLRRVVRWEEWEAMAAARCEFRLILRISGLKPTPGRIPSTGHFREGWRVRVVGDGGTDGANSGRCAGVFDVMKGPDAGRCAFRAIERDLSANVNWTECAWGYWSQMRSGNVTGKLIRLLEEPRFCFQKISRGTVSFERLSRAIELWWFSLGRYRAFICTDGGGTRGGIEPDVSRIHVGGQLEN